MGKDGKDGKDYNSRKAQYYEDYYSGKSTVVSSHFSYEPEPAGETNYEQLLRTDEEKRTQFNSLKAVVNTSMGFYDEDISTIGSVLDQLDNNSPIIQSFIEMIQNRMSAFTYDSDYQEVIDCITEDLTLLT